MCWSNIFTSLITTPLLSYNTLLDSFSLMALSRLPKQSVLSTPAQFHIAAVILAHYIFQCLVWKLPSHYFLFSKVPWIFSNFSLWNRIAYLWKTKNPTWLLTRITSNLQFNLWEMDSILVSRAHNENTTLSPVVETRIDLSLHWTLPFRFQSLFLFIFLNQNLCESDIVAHGLLRLQRRTFHYYTSLHIHTWKSFPWATSLFPVISPFTFLGFLSCELYRPQGTARSIPAT